MAGAVLSRVITFLQSDIKKLIAYRRVTHITFIVVGLASGRKVIFIRTVLLSLAHGWASIGIFFSGGIFRNATSSRIGTLLGAEGPLHFVPLFLGVLLLINASVPPLPSFFPELALVRVINRTRVNLFWLFTLLSFTVCYYNSFFFLLVSQIKASVQTHRSHNLLELFVFSYFTAASIFSLGYLFKL